MISAIAALIFVAGSCVALKPGSTGYSATWLSVLGVSGIAGPTDYLHFWNPASLDETDQGPGGNDATSFNFDPDSADGWNMGTDNNKYVLLDGPITNGTSYTITMWVKPDVTAMNANNNGGFFISEQTGASNNDFQLAYIKNNNTRFLVYDASNSFQFDINTNIQNNVWQHFAAVADDVNNIIEVWIDGSSDGASTMTITPGNTFLASSVFTTIGSFSGNPGDANRKFHGSIGKVRFYNRALTQQEILDEIAADGNSGP